MTVYKMSFYCGDTLTSTDDLNKIYFKDINGDKYYSSPSNSRQNIPETVSKCGSNETVSTALMTTISVPPNMVGYLYQNSFSTSYNAIVEGDYYTNNSTSTTEGDATIPYSGEKIIDLHIYPPDTFANNCYCSSFDLIGNKKGVNSDMCGGLYNEPDTCNPDALGDPPTSTPPPRIFRPDIDANITGWLWGIFGIIAFVFVLAIIIGILMLFGVFSAGKSTEALAQKNKEMEMQLQQTQKPVQKAFRRPVLEESIIPGSPLGEGTF